MFGVSGQKMLFDISSGVPVEVLEEFHARGGADPTVNPRLRAVLQRPAVVLTEPDFISDEARSRHPFYQEFLNKVGTPYVVGALFKPSPSVDVVLSADRSDRQGPASEAQRAILSALIPHLAAATRTQVRLEAQAAAVALGALDRLALPALLCDFAGRIVGASDEGERLLAEAGLVVRREGRLRAVSEQSDRDLQDRMAQAAALATTPPALAVLFSTDGSEVAVADVMRLPLGEHAFALEARTLVVVGAPKRRSQDVLLALGLTRAEADVARQMAEGLGGAEIAALRGSSLETVRSQIKAVYAKLDVRRRLELAAKLRGLV